MGELRRVHLIPTYNGNAEWVSVDVIDDDSGFRLDCDELSLRVRTNGELYATLKTNMPPTCERVTVVAPPQMQANLGAEAKRASRPKLAYTIDIPHPMDGATRSEPVCPECGGAGEIALATSVQPCSRGCKAP